MLTVASGVTVASIGTYQIDKQLVHVERFGIYSHSRTSGERLLLVVFSAFAVRAMMAAFRHSGCS